MATRKRKTAEELREAIVKKKRPRLQLSNLPMDILCSILSRLPMKEAARTSILSSQWRYIWCHQTSLTLEFRTMMQRVSWSYSKRSLCRQEFIKRVDTVLMQCNGAGAEKINIHFDLDDRHAVDVDRWVNFEIASKTKALTLELWFYHPEITCKHRISDPDRKEPYNFPFQLFDACDGSHLQSLHLSSISMKLPTGFKGFVKLKMLYLSGVSITDEDLGHFLSKCNLLEFFGMSYCTTITSLTIPHSSNQLKHLQINECPLLREIQLHCGLALLEYRGPVISFVSGGALSLTDVRIKLLGVRTSLENLFTELPSTMRCPEVATSKCGDLKRAIPSRRLPSFLCLRHVRLEITIFVSSERKTDVLDLGYLLQAAPSMEKLELHMEMRYYHKRYHHEDGELRSLPSYQHSHLKLVQFTGFFGHKDQLELALHILRNSVMLEDMKVDPRVAIHDVPVSPLDTYEECLNLDGFLVASEFLYDADRRKVLDLVPIFTRALSFKKESKALRTSKKVSKKSRNKRKKKKTT